MRIQPSLYNFNKNFSEIQRQNGRSDVFIKNKQKAPSFSAAGEDRDNPIILEPEDIAIHEPKIFWQTTKKGNDGKYYTYKFFLDSRKDATMPVQGESTSWTGKTKGNASDYIYNAWEDRELRNILRSMQFNNGEIPRGIIAGYEAEYIFLPEELGISQEEWHKRYPSKESYVRTKTDEIYSNLKGQEEELKRLKPTLSECILYRGISLNSQVLRKNSDYDNFKKLYNSLKEGDVTILDWAPMCATGSIDYAICAGADILRIIVPKGARLPHGTNEFRFPSKSQFKFHSKKDYNGITFWDFEYIIPQPESRL